jgi:hypothetical protein
VKSKIDYRVDHIVRDIPFDNKSSCIIYARKSKANLIKLLTKIDSEVRAGRYSDAKFSGFIRVPVYQVEELDAGDGCMYEHKSHLGSIRFELEDGEVVGVQIDTLLGLNITKYEIEKEAQHGDNQ